MPAIAISFEKGPSDFLIMLRRLLFSALVAASPVIASSNSGPMVYGCDYKLSEEKPQLSDVCLLNAHFNMGQRWFSVNPIRSGTEFTFRTNDSRADESMDGVIRGADNRPLFHEATIRSNGKEIWKGTYKELSEGREAACRIGSTGGETKYLLSNGAFICIWDRSK